MKVPQFAYEMFEVRVWSTGWFRFDRLVVKC